MSITEVENALRAWVVSASGYTEDAVLWANENGVRPTGNVITLALSSTRSLGACDAVEDLTNGVVEGEEIEHRVRGEREHVLRIQAYTPDAANGAASARAVLLDVQTKVALPSIANALALAGISVFDTGAVQYVPAINNAAFEGRGVLEVRLYAVESASERGGYIAAVQGDGTLEGGFDTVLINIDVTS